MSAHDPFPDAAFIAPSAELYGDVRLGADSSVWPKVVMRAESAHIEIGVGTNIQDFVMVHVGAGHPSLIGDWCSITHHVTVHGAAIGDRCLIGINATLMDGCVIGEGSIVAGNSLVREGVVIPPHSIVAGVPAKVIGSRDNRVPNTLNALAYVENAHAYRAGNHRRWSEPSFAAFMAEQESVLKDTLS